MPFESTTVQEFLQQYNPKSTSFLKATLFGIWVCQLFGFGGLRGELLATAYCRFHAVVSAAALATLSTPQNVLRRTNGSVVTARNFETAQAAAKKQN